MSRQFLNQPLISVVIPTYNRAQLIIETINSVLNQTYKNLEIIVIDDGSTDETEKIIKNIKDSRIRYLKHQQNLGGAKARNTGIEAATGEYICFLDSDDIWLSQKVELQLAFMQQFTNLDKVVSYTQRKFLIPYWEICKNRPQVKQRPLTDIKESDNLADYLFCDGGDMQTSTLMLKNSFAKAVGFRSDLKKHQDWDFCLRLEAKGAKFAFLSKPLTVYQNELRDDRISRITTQEISLSWIKEYRFLISDRAVTGFLFQAIFPILLKEQKQKIYAQKIIFDAWKHQIISWLELQNLTNRIWMYKQIKQRLKYKILKTIGVKKIIYKIFS